MLARGIHVCSRNARSTKTESITSNRHGTDGIVLARRSKKLRQDFRSTDLAKTGPCLLEGYTFVREMRGAQNLSRSHRTDMARTGSSLLEGQKKLRQDFRSTDLAKTGPCLLEGYTFVREMRGAQKLSRSHQKN